jgi:hypothetical protein
VASIEKVGVILVHGIGEQRRFQHLDGQLRDLLGALGFLQDQHDIEEISVDIPGGGAAAFHADHDTWNAGPEASVTIVVHHVRNGIPTETRLLVHEVWWADVNEPYSLAKQFRFWLWGLAIWAQPGKPRSSLQGADRVAAPVVPGQRWAWDRIRLFLVGYFFALLGFSIGTLTFLANRLFMWQTPDVLRVIANYISAVKLYNQSWRYGAGLVWAREDFLDAVGEPPRVSVRRRMIRAIADVACNNYDRWYILAHSQGSVVAFNGLMETAYAWPGYLEKDRWDRLCQSGLAGPALPTLVPPQGRVMPRRPVWAADDDISYRRRIFARFRGLLTYGSPLEKFAGLWPALVPISREPVFSPWIPWLNIHDPTDPVSGRLLAFDRQPRSCCPHAVNIGYAASWWLLLAHLKYLTHRRPRPDVATATAWWLLTDSTTAFLHARRNNTGWSLGTWFGWNTPQRWLHSAIAWASWFGAALVLLMLGAIMLPLLLQAAGALLDVTWQKVAELTGAGEAARQIVPTAMLADGWHWIAGPADTYWQRVWLLAKAAALLPLVVGGIHWAWTTWRAEQHMNPPPSRAAVGPASPQPGAPGFAVTSDEPR